MSTNQQNSEAFNGHKYFIVTTVDRYYQVFILQRTTTTGSLPIYDAQRVGVLPNAITWLRLTETVFHIIQIDTVSLIYSIFNCVFGLPKISKVVKVIHIDILNDLFVNQKYALSFFDSALCDGMSRKQILKHSYDIPKNLTHESANLRNIHNTMALSNLLIFIEPCF